MTGDSLTGMAVFMMVNHLKAGKRGSGAWREADQAPLFAGLC